MFSDTRKDYFEKGYAKVEGFFSESEISQLISEVRQIEQLSQTLDKDDDIFQFEKKNGKATKLLRRIERVSWILCKRVFLALRHSVLELDIKPV